MRVANILFSCAALLSCDAALATLPTTVVAKVCESAEHNEVEPSLPHSCQGGRTYQLQFLQRTNQIVLKVDKKLIVLHRIPKRFDPSLVGSESVIGFLPKALQTYRKSKILLYITSIRTSGGDGSGQCGSGSEIHLNFLDISSTEPKVKSRILIGSCEASIELSDQEVPNGKVGLLSVVDNKLTLEFMYYGGMEGSPTATVSADFKRLDFK